MREKSNLLSFFLKLTRFDCCEMKVLLFRLLGGVSLGLRRQRIYLDQIGEFVWKVINLPRIPGLKQVSQSSLGKHTIIPIFIFSHTCLSSSSSSRYMTSATPDSLTACMSTLVS